VSEETGKPSVEELSVRLEQERNRAADALEDLGAAHEEELRREREARERAITVAEGRLAEIETHAEAAERRVEEAERRAAEAEASIADEKALARESAAAWLRGQVEAIRREARE
jgi:hypothetical protein